MNSETDGIEPGRDREGRRAGHRTPEFVCREGTAVAGSLAGQALCNILYDLPLRPGFTAEVIARIIASETAGTDQTPMP